MNHRSNNAAAASGFLSLVGVSASGLAGLSFLVATVDVPLWFITAAIVLPTGDILAVARTYIDRVTVRAAPRDDRE